MGPHFRFVGIGVLSFMRLLLARRLSLFHHFLDFDSELGYVYIHIFSPRLCSHGFGYCLGLPLVSDSFLTHTSYLCVGLVRG